MDLKLSALFPDHVGIWMRRRAVGLSIANANHVTALSRLKQRACCSGFSRWRERQCGGHDLRS
jgi:hypothetical protein